MSVTSMQSVSAGDLLQTYQHASLQQMARQRGLDIKGKSKGQLIQFLAKTLYDPARIVAALDDLEPTERAALDSLVLQGGQVSTEVLRQQLETDKKITPQPAGPHGLSYYDRRGSVRERGSSKFEDIVARLGVVGLVFTADTGQYRGNVELVTPGTHLFVPEPILQHLPRPNIEIETAQQPAVERAADPRAFLRDLYILLSFARDHPIPLTVRGQMHKRSLTRIDESLRVRENAAQARSEADLSRLPLLRALAEHLHLLTVSAGGLRLGEAATEFLPRLQGERQRMLFEAYGKTERWSELAHLPGVTARATGQVDTSLIVAARRRVLKEIAELPPGRWIPIAHLVDRMRMRAYEFLIPRGSVSGRHYYYGSSSYYTQHMYEGYNPLNLAFESDSSAEVDWQAVEGGFIRVVVTQALHWLGVLDVGAAEDEGEPCLFRITEAGAALLHGGTPSTEPLPPRVVVQPNFQVLVFDPTGEDVLFTLDRFARRLRAEQVVEFELTRESVYAAQRAGMEIDAILAFLDNVTSAPLPQNVRRSLEEWGAQHDRIVIRRHTAAVQAVDEHTLDAIYADPALRAVLGRRIAPTIALVPADRLDAIFDRLVKHGGAAGLPLPVLTEGNDAWKGGAIVADAEGRIDFRHRLPSIYVLHELRPFVEERPDGSLQLTRDSLRRAARSCDRGGASYSADEIIAALERVHTGPLPPEVAAMVRRWAKDWGRGALVEAVLFQVESAEVMDDLLADRELQPYLHPLPGAPALALIRHDDVQPVQALLQERGMELSGQLLQR